MTRALFLLIILTFCIMLPLSVSTSAGGVVPTPTQETTNQQLAINGSLLRNVRLCPDTSCAFEYAYQPRATFWFCWQTAPVLADGFMWVKLSDGNWVSVSFGARKYVAIQERYRVGEGC